MVMHIFPWCQAHIRRQGEIFHHVPASITAKRELRLDLKHRIHQGEVFQAPEGVELGKVLKIVQDLAGEYYDANDGVRHWIAMKHAEAVVKLMR